MYFTIHTYNIVWASSRWLQNSRDESSSRLYGSSERNDSCIHFCQSASDRRCSFLLNLPLYVGRTWLPQGDLCCMYVWSWSFARQKTSRDTYTTRSLRGRVWEVFLMCCSIWSILCLFSGSIGSRSSALVFGKLGVFVSDHCPMFIKQTAY